MEEFQFGDIVLLDYPFAEQRVSKRRPALTLLTDSDGDILVCRITSKNYTELSDVVIDDWQEAGLNVPSIIRFTKMVTVGVGDIRKKVGALTHSDKSIAGNTLVKVFHSAVSK